MILEGVPIEGKYGATYEGCYASIRGNFSVVQREKFGKGYFLVANLIVYLNKQARLDGKEQLESVQVVAALPSDFPEVDSTIISPYALLYGEIHKQFPGCVDC